MWGCAVVGAAADLAESVGSLKRGQPHVVIQMWMQHFTPVRLRGISSLKLTVDFYDPMCGQYQGGWGVSYTSGVIQNHCGPHINPVSFMEILPIILIGAATSSWKMIFPQSLKLLEFQQGINRQHNPHATPSTGVWSGSLPQGQPNSHLPQHWSKRTNKQYLHGSPARCFDTRELGELTVEKQTAPIERNAFPL